MGLGPSAVLQVVPEDLWFQCVVVVGWTLPCLGQGGVSVVGLSALAGLIIIEVVVQWTWVLRLPYAHTSPRRPSWCAIFAKKRAEHHRELTTTAINKSHLRLWPQPAKSGAGFLL